MSKSSSSPKVVLITGCSAGGLGAALAERFAAEGCTVFASARNTSKLEALSSSIHRVALDVSDDASVGAAVAHVIDTAGHIDVLVNSAGGNRVGALMDVPVRDVAALFEVNVLAALRVTQAVVPHMAARRSGLVVNIGSIAGNTASPWYGPYSASKAALHSLTDTLDMELRHVGVRVLLIALGMVHSNIIANTTAKHTAPPPNSLYDAFRANIDARLGQGDDVMSQDEFARKTVAAALSSNPPTYLQFGGQANTAWLLSFIPRGPRLNMFWKAYTAKKPLV